MNTPADEDWIDAVARGAFEAPDAVDGSPDDDDTPPIDIDAVLAYRDGTASEAEQARIEASLADDPEARALLRELAQPVPPFVEGWARREARSALGASRRRWIGPAVTVALAAAVALFVFVPRGAPAPDYRIDAVRGVQAPVRGDAPTAVAGGAVDPESILTIALAPAAAVGEAPAARAFVQTPDGRLVAAPRSAIVAGEGGALRFEAPVAELFGRGPEAFGQRTLWLVVGADAEALAALDGRTVEAARAELDGVRWLPVALEYGEAAR